MIIDAHFHVCGGMLTPESLLRLMDKSGVDQVVLMPSEQNSSKEYLLPFIAALFPFCNVVKLTNVLTRFMMKFSSKVHEVALDNECVYRIKQQLDSRIIQFYWITQSISHPFEELECKYKLWSFKGVKMHQCCEDFAIDSDFFRTTAMWCEMKRLPLFMHLYSDRDVYSIIEYKKQHPQLILIVAHLFGMELFIKSGLKDQNLYFDSSHYLLVPDERIINAVRYFGASQILFGSHTPYGGNISMQRNKERIERLSLTTRQQSQILGYNMYNLLVS